MFHKIASFILRNRPLVSSILILFTLFMAFEASKVKLAYENNKLTPNDDPDFLEYVKFKKEFGEDGNKMIVGFTTKDLFHAPFYSSLYQVCEQTNQINGVKEVVSPARFYNLNKNDELAKFEIQKLPLNRPNSQEEVDSIEKVFSNLGFYKNVLYQPHNKICLVVLTLDQKIIDSEKRIPMLDSIENAFEVFGKKHNMEIHFSGMPYVRNEFAIMVKSELLKFTLLAVAVTALFLLIFFRSFTNIWVPLVLIGTGVVWALGIQGIIGYNITILTGIIPPLMVVIGIPNSIYLINKYHIEYKKHGNKIKALTRVISKVGPSNLLTNLTTAIGFGVFYFTNTNILTQFGVVSFFSILSISILTIVLLPIIYSVLPAPSIKQTKHIDNKVTNAFVEWTHRLIFNRKRRIYFFAFVLLVLSVFGLAKLKPLVYIVDDVPKYTKLYKDLKFFEDNFSGIMPLEIVIDCGEEDGLKDTRTLQRIVTLQKRLEEFPELSRAFSIVDMLAFANQEWHERNPKYYRLPNKTTLASIANYLPQNENNREGMMGSMVDKNYRKARISLQVKDIGSEKMQILTDNIRTQLNDIFPKSQFQTKITGNSYLFMIGNRYLVKSLFQSVLIAFVLIAIIMGSLFTSFKMVLVSLIPNTIPLLITAGIMGFFGVPLKPSTILVFSIAFGIAIDDTIHFLAKFRQELKVGKKSIRSVLSLTVKEMGSSLLYTSVVLFFGFIIFSFSEFQGTVSLGILTSISLFFALFANLFVLPALILSYEKRLNPRHELKESVIELPNENEEEEG